MFTLAQVQSAIDATATDSVYSMSNNAASYLLSTIQSPYARGSAVERLVCDTLTACGIDAEHVGGKGQSDIVAFVGGRRVTIEVKSATLIASNRRYTFHGIDPDQFDILALVFIHPTMGPIVRTVSKLEFHKWWRIGGKGDCQAEWSTQKDGYSIGFNEDMENWKINTIEWNPESLRA